MWRIFFFRILLNIMDPKKTRESPSQSRDLCYTSEVRADFNAGVSVSHWKGISSADPHFHAVPMKRVLSRRLFLYAFPVFRAFREVCWFGYSGR